MREDPIDTPMRIYPAVHYSMGGIWVDFEKGHDSAIDVSSPRNQMTNIAGLYAAGECDYQYHGANRLGANALLSCLYGGEITSQGVLAYLKEMNADGDSASAIVEDEAHRRESEYQNLREAKGNENPYRLHAELADLMWNRCGIWRRQAELTEASNTLNDLRERAHQCAVLDNSAWTNQAIPFTRALINMIEQSRAIVAGALERQESRGAHFKMDTPNRDDEHWLRTTLAKWAPEGPEFDFEPIDTTYIPPRGRKYRINQNKIVELIMDEPIHEPSTVRAETVPQ